jgi:ribosome recycling factor
MPHPVLNDAQAKMKKAVDYTLHEFSSIHTGKATPAMVESVMVEAYGTQMRLRDCAAITTPDARLIQIQPWDASLIKAVEKAVQAAKTAHRLAEEGRVHVRNVRRDALETLKKAKLPEDETKRVEKDIQAATDRSIKEINDHLASKEAELLNV